MNTRNFKEYVKTSNYNMQAEEFLRLTNSEIKKEYIGNDKHFDDDEAPRDIWGVTIVRGIRSYSFKFGQSIASSKRYRDKATKTEFDLLGRKISGPLSTKKVTQEFLQDECTLINGDEPDDYSILTCLQNYDVGAFEDFCAEFGYNTDSRKAEKIYHQVQNEYLNVTRLYSDEEIELLQEIR